MPASTIEEVLTRLETIITDSRRNNDRIGIFASLYYKVTAKVKEGIEKNEFQNGPRMEKLDVIFANRYLTALDQWQSTSNPSTHPSTQPNPSTLTNAQLTAPSTTQPAAPSNPQPVPHPSACWHTAFQATKAGSHLILQHLLLGINAHINLDLGIAAVETMQGQNFQDIEKDFDSINTIISSLTYEVINDINRMSPLISLIGLHSGKTESIFIQFSISNARDGAWCFAEDLSKAAGPDDYQTQIQTRDKAIDTLAGALTNFKGTLRFTVWLIHLFEWKSPTRIIDLLHNFKKTYIKAQSILGAKK